jgi:hypothetical protein
MKELVPLKPRMAYPDIRELWITIQRSPTSTRNTLAVGMTPV